MTDSTYNVLIIGLSGVGKSSLINYVFGQNVADVGIGEPVTQKGFHMYPCIKNDLKISFFDSWGLEVGKEKEWTNLLNEELDKRDITKSADNWFHSIFYCINAASQRIQLFEINIIKNIQNKKYNVTIIFTNSDNVTENEINSLKECIYKEIKNVKIINACSISTKKRGSPKIENYGKEDIENDIYINFWNSIILRLPERCQYLIFQEIEKAKLKIINHVDCNMGWFNYGTINDEVLYKINNFKKQLLNIIDSIITNEILQTVKMYNLFSKALKYPITQNNFIYSSNIFISNFDNDWGVEMAARITVSILTLGLAEIITADMHKEHSKEKINNVFQNWKNEIQFKVKPDITNYLNKLLPKSK